MSKKEKKPQSKGSKTSKGKGGGGKDKGKIGGGKKVKTPEPPPPPSPPPQPVEPPPPKVKPKGTCYENTTPGPGAYAATCLVGYYDHDPTKKREPAFTFSSATRYPKRAQHSIPGPKYKSEGTRFGPPTETGPVITGRHSEIHKGYLTPGPGHYSPEKYDNPRAHKSPEARLLGRFYEDKSSRFTPGPGDYNTPSSIGDHHPIYNSAPSAQITGRSWEQRNRHKFHFTPGPNQYDYDNNAFMKSGPSARLLGRDGLKVGQKKITGPGPGAYFAGFNEGADAPAFSFGRRHAPCVYVPPENDDYSF